MRKDLPKGAVKRRKFTEPILAFFVDTDTNSLITNRNSLVAKEFHSSKHVQWINTDMFRDLLLFILLFGWGQSSTEIFLSPKQDHHLHLNSRFSSRTESHQFTSESRHKPFKTLTSVTGKIIFLFLANHFYQSQVNNFTCCCCCECQNQ